MFAPQILDELCLAELGRVEVVGALSRSLLLVVEVAEVD